MAYGFLYGVFPSLVAETFGVSGLSTNWGCISLAPVIFGNIFNILYGRPLSPTRFVSRTSQYSAADHRPAVIFLRSNLRFPFHHPSRRHAQVQRFPRLLQRGLSGYVGRQRGERSDQPMEHPACQRDNIESQQGRQGVGCCKRSLKGKDAAIILEEGGGHIFIEMGERGHNLMF